MNQVNKILNITFRIPFTFFDETLPNLLLTGSECGLPSVDVGKVRRTGPDRNLVQSARSGL